MGAAAATGLGAALYSAHSNKEAVESFHDSGTNAKVGGEPVPKAVVGMTPPVIQNVPPQASVAPTPAQSQRPQVEVHNHGDSGTGNLVMGYMLGNAMNRHETVVVQTPGSVAPPLQPSMSIDEPAFTPSGNVMGDSRPSASSSSAAAWDAGLETVEKVFRFSLMLALLTLMVFFVRRTFFPGGDNPSSKKPYRL